MQRLATSGDVRACVAATAIAGFRWSNGRVETLPDDACSLLAIDERFEAADYCARSCCRQSSQRTPFPVPGRQEERGERRG